MSIKLSNFLKLSVAICILLVGFSFFYHYVIFLPQKEQSKLDQERAANEQKLKNQKESELRTFSNDAKNALLNFCSIADKAILTCNKKGTIGDAIKSFDNLSERCDQLRQEVFRLNAFDETTRNFTSVFSVMVDNLEEFIKNGSRCSNYEIQKYEGVEELQRLESLLAQYRTISTSLFVTWEDSYKDIENKAKQQKQRIAEKEQLVKSCYDDFSLEVNEFSKSAGVFLAKYSSMFGLDFTLNSQSDDK